MHLSFLFFVVYLHNIVWVLISTRPGNFTTVALINRHFLENTCIIRISSLMVSLDVCTFILCMLNFSKNVVFIENGLNQ